MKSIYVIFLLLFLWQIKGMAQDAKPNPSSKAGWISLGGRSTWSFFDDDGTGIGTGGQYRVQFSSRVNTDWYADYISINMSNKVRSEYLHIGWSVLFYPFQGLQYPKLLQPYILAGHCFDYNRKTVMSQPSIYKERGGSAVQAGLGTHFNLSERFDFSLTCQYMIHLTKEIRADITGNTVELVKEKGSAFEGHLLTTLSFNYKIFRLWKK